LPGHPSPQVIVCIGTWVASKGCILAWGRRNSSRRTVSWSQVSSVTEQISCWMNIGRGKAMQPHVLTALHMQSCGLVLGCKLSDEMMTEVAQGEFTLANTLERDSGSLLIRLSLRNSISHIVGNSARLRPPLPGALAARDAVHQLVMNSTELQIALTTLAFEIFGARTMTCAETQSNRAFTASTKLTGLRSGTSGRMLPYL
jgi:hypothetical protein